MTYIPKVSVCVPTYNGSRYLESCLDSLTHQTFENIEILAVDDCSTDSTLEILERYAVKDQRVRVTRNKQNLGLVGNWNRCVELAQTEWIKFVFQDDVIKPTCIEHMLAAAQATKSLITACRREFIFESVPDQLRDEYRKFVEELTLDNAFSSKTLISASEFCGKVLRYGSANFIGEPTSLLIHRDAFVKYGAFNANLIQLCDLEYWYRVGVNEGITFVPETLVQFRVHTTSTTSSNSSLRAYVAEVLDPLLLQHEFAFNPLYAPLRSCALRSIPRRKMKREFATKALWVHATAIVHSKDQQPAESNQIPIDYWNELVCKYPRLEKGAHLAWGKFQRWLASNITWRFHV